MEELLRHQADADVKNRLGNHPVHEAWSFWQTLGEHPLRSQAQREAQEAATCSILEAVFSYGGFVDSTDQDGQTALHIACRRGPTRAVKLCLAFKAKAELRTHSHSHGRCHSVRGVSGLLPAEICVQFGQEESFRMVRAWARIAHYLVHLDFHTGDLMTTGGGDTGTSAGHGH